ncbi:MAG: hypothetical protein LBL23_08145 [Coriobacteriales bacterium]|jgi:2'-5' RNA ligase|nr:hypothetical protein [Coriobacteriales bacterium]
MRLFVAVTFSDEVKDSLAILARELERQASAGRFVPRENFHLTLAFLGTTERFAELEEMLRHTARLELAEPLELCLEGIGSFKAGRKSSRARDGRAADASARRGGMTGGKTGEGRAGEGKARDFANGTGYTWWVGVAENPGLLRLAGVLSRALREAGFSRERRSFKPHVTLGRAVVTRKPVELILPELSVEVHSLSLMKSDLSAALPVYTEIFRT